MVHDGGTVRRPAGPGSPFVRALLAHLESWPGAPRHLGLEDGDEVLEYLPGAVAAARLLRGFHDLTEGTPLAAGAEAVCHNDIAPKNTVFRGGRPVAFMAHLCRQFLGLGPTAEAGASARAIAAVRDAYGLPDPQGALVDRVLWWQTLTADGIEEGAARGDAALRAFVERGAVAEACAAHRWVTAHRETLAAP
ncbi:trifolitoxin immunity protein [Nocardiopsis changdeensis]|uniref:Trifolitoxin immunity protein n=1 Tax=Nocardiopsis changdeensis TaxID=2831969 RepID=A0ABX8BNN4_9ACTN|nr:MULTISPECIES: trifolitoxin immunity protein [Nocardiopsis]QUX23855.1 trifolitoxin immunity protein [Nocardiopsis changdeensis]QYX39801.1 trifolitoxin immunity protein [Nocardiopsis sp. MT53]